MRTRCLYRDRVGDKIFLRQLPAEAERLLVNTTHEFFGTKPPMPKNFILGRLYFYASDKVKARDAYQNARAYIERAVAEQPQSVFVQLGLAELMAGIGQRDEAMRLCERAKWKCCPSSRDAYHGADRTRVLGGDLRHARGRRSPRIIDRTRARHPFSSNAAGAPFGSEVGLNPL